MSQLPFFDHKLPIAIAHRGGMAVSSENSMEAFAYTAGLGYRYIETDVRATENGEVYTWHGPSDKDKDESPLDLSTLSAKTRHNLPLLIDVLNAFPDIKFQIDPKHWLVVEPLAEVIIKAKAVDRVSIGSFSDARIHKVAQIVHEKTGRKLSTAMGPKAIKRLYLRSRLAPSRRWHTTFQSVMPPSRIATKRFVKAAHSGNLLVIPWTVNEKKEMISLLDKGVDGLITDYPSRLKEVLTSRGQWSE